MSQDLIDSRQLIIRLAYLPLGVVLALGFVLAGWVTTAAPSTDDSRAGAATALITEHGCDATMD